jgi:hypothetical protein
VAQQFTGEPQLVEALDALESGDDSARAALELQIAEAAERDPAFALDLSELLELARVRTPDDQSLSSRSRRPGSP